MKIMLTGSSGYLGSEWLRREGTGYDVIEYDIQNGDDLLDEDVLREKMSGCDQVLHLAAIPKPVEGKSFEDYFQTNCVATQRVMQAAVANGVRRVVYASSTSMYGIERGIPFSVPITESKPLVSQYLKADELACRPIDLAYHSSKVIAEQIVAWYGLMKQVEVVALRFGPINKVFLGTSVSIENATQALTRAIEAVGPFWYEPFSIVDELEHISIASAQEKLGYQPLSVDYDRSVIRSSLDERAKKQK